MHLSGSTHAYLSVKAQTYHLISPPSTCALTLLTNPFLSKSCQLGAISNFPSCTSRSLYWLFSMWGLTLALSPVFIKGLKSADALKWEKKRTMRHKERMSKDIDGSRSEDRPEWWLYHDVWYSMIPVSWYLTRILLLLGNLTVLSRSSQIFAQQSQSETSVFSSGAQKWWT